LRFVRHEAKGFTRQVETYGEKRQKGFKGKYGVKMGTKGHRKSQNPCPQQKNSYERVTNILRTARQVGRFQTSKLDRTYRIPRNYFPTNPRATGRKTILRLVVKYLHAMESLTFRNK